MSRKQLEYDLAAYESAAFDYTGDIKYPFAWAILFLVDHQVMLASSLENVGFPELADELRDIIDWVENGDPETREEDENI